MSDTSFEYKIPNFMGRALPLCPLKLHRLTFSILGRDEALMRFLPRIKCYGLKWRRNSKHRAPTVWVVIQRFLFNKGGLLRLSFYSHC